MKNTESSDPREHARNIREEMNKLIDHLRKDIEKVENDKAKALFETSAEVLQGLSKAFEHFTNKSEKVWSD